MSAQRPAGGALAAAGNMRHSRPMALPPSPLADAVARAEANAPYLKALIRRRAATLAAIERDGFDAALAAATTFDPALPVAERLRAAKADVALIVALADLAGAWPLERVTAALSAFADAALDASIAAALAERGGDNAGFVAIALGKLGSFELNYSSDVDLILLYDPARIPVRPREEVADAAVRIARRVVALMADATGGYVFRVDLRLRPSSEITPIALPVAAAEQYYQSEAETWERTAFVRARAAAGDVGLGQAFLSAIRPFVWRRSLDWTAVRDIKAVSLRIRDHAGGPAVGPGFDLKKGRGGIREVEFFAQIHQLIWGGRDAALRAPATLDALAALTAAGRIAGGDAAVLADAYRFLRTLEHRVQMIADAQTHVVPATAAARTAVAALDGRDWRGIERDLKRHTAAVATRYDRLIADAGRDDAGGVPAAPAAWLAAAKLDAGVAALIARWRSGRYRALRSADARDRFEALLPDLLRGLAGAADPGHAIARLDSFLAALPAGVQFFALLAANPKLLPLFGRLLGVAPVLADALARRPALFDALLADDSFASLPDVSRLIAELGAAAGPGASPEDSLDRVRLWTADRRFQLGAQLIEGRDPLGVGADLSAVADAGVAVLSRCVGDDFARDHGTVPGGRLVVLGLGRYGGRALTHASDLDLVYLFTGSHDAVSDGARPLGATVYFQRLAARLTAALSVPTAAGALYEVDTRLRPSGAKGLLAVTVDSFARYQTSEAETWEHMALCRARVVAAAPDDAAAVAAVIAEVLAQPKDFGPLRAAVVAMRRDVAAAKPGGGPWDVKLARGGLVDLEFIVHFLQLRDRAAFTPDLRAALVHLVARGSLPDDLIAAHDTLTRVLAVLRLVVAGPLPRRFATPVAALLAHVAGAGNFTTAEANVGLAKAAVRAAWSDVFGPGD